MSTFGDNIRRIRFERGMTQDELAALIGSQKQAISRYENGTRKPSIVAAKQYAVALGVPLSALVSDPANNVSDEIELPHTHQELYGVSVQKSSI